jgi:hypothetical protein
MSRWGAVRAELNSVDASGTVAGTVTGTVAGTVAGTVEVLGSAWFQPLHLKYEISWFQSCALQTGQLVHRYVSGNQSEEDLNFYMNLRGGALHVESS